MNNCVACFEEVNSDGVRYPAPEYEGQRFIHRNCLISKIAELCQDDRYEKILRYLVSFEEEHKGNFISEAIGTRRDWAVKYSGNSADSYWHRDEIKLKTQEIKRLLDYKVVGTILSSRRDPGYALCNRETIKQFLSEPATILAQDESSPFNLDESIFSPIVGYDDVKANIIQAIRSGKRIHWLFEGVPASSKTLFLTCIERALGDKCYYATGSRTTGVGLTEALLLYTPIALIVDEIDKVPQDALGVLLSVMESGDVVQTKHRSHLKVRVNTMVVGACNSSMNLPAELLSRFKPYHLYFGPYKKEEYIQVCQGYLNKFENIPEDLSNYIGEKTWKVRNADVREARGIARMLLSNSRQEVDSQLAFLGKYRKGWLE